MGTASTKSRNRKRGAQPIAAAGSFAVEPGAPEVSERAWQIASILIFVLAAFLRLYHLSLVPLHHDEGVNGNFLVHLVRDGSYHYDPANYHGPTLYYFAAVFPWLLRVLFGPSAQNSYGLTTTVIRLVPTLFGLATVGLIFTLRRNLGTIATLGAALLLAISPGAVYLSRYFIHETLFVFFTLALVIALIKFYELNQPYYLVLASISAALLFATKETAMISAGVLIIALAMTIAYRRFIAPPTSRKAGKKLRKTNDRPADPDDEGWDGGTLLAVWIAAAINTFVALNVLSYSLSQTATAKQTTIIWGTVLVVSLAVTFGYNSLSARLRPGRLLAVWIVVAIITFVSVNVLFYSSFFTNYPKGVYDSLKTFEFWTKTGKEAHKHPKATYFWWLLLQESPLLVFGAIGAALAVLKPLKSFALFCALWAFGLIAAYSLIAYKTPWLSLNFIVPLALTSGVAIQWLHQTLARREVGKRMRWAALAGIVLIAIGPLPGLARIFDQVVTPEPWPGLLAALKQTEPHWKTFIPGYQTIDLNFFNYDNDNRYYVYVYAHTRREALKLVDEINRIAQRTHQGAATGITIVSPDYWPLPWYFRDYNRVGYYGRITPSNEPIILASSSQAAEVQSTYGDRYQQIQSGFNLEGSFPLRPGVDLMLYARRELLP